MLCDACMVKNDDAVKLCAACETPRPGVEEEAKAAEEEARKAKEAEMAAKLASSQQSVAAAGISFGLPAAASIGAAAAPS